MPNVVLKNAGRGFIPGRVDIDERPEIVELKERFGDLEIDTIIGKNTKVPFLPLTTEQQAGSGYASCREKKPSR